MVYKEKFKLLNLFISEIKAEQTLFSLPLVFVGALMGSNFNLNLQQIVLILIAVASARALGMLLNRIIDRTIDRLNPRTANRHIASGKISLFNSYILTLACLVIYLISAYALGPLPFKLSPIPVLLFLIYPHTKRFSWLCHFVLGVTLGLAPLAGWIAVSNSVSLVPFLLFVGTTLWVAGFDIFYATMDFDFDREHSLHSFPSRFGLKKSVVFTILIHLISVLLFFLAGVIYGLGAYFFVFLSIASFYLIFLDCVFAPKLSTPDINKYLQSNSYFSVIVFLGVFVDMATKRVS